MIIWDFLIDIVFYHFGFFFLRGVTFGRFPKKYDEDHDDNIVIFVGAIVFVLLATFATILFL